MRDDRVNESDTITGGREKDVRTVRERAGERSAR